MSYLFEIPSSDVGFQIDTSKMVLSANQIEAEGASANQKTGSGHHFEN